MVDSELRKRLDQHAIHWRVDLEERCETETSLIAFGNRAGRAVALKVIRQPGDEWCSGEILEAFDGNGIARVYKHAPGAVLIERLTPGNSLVELARDGRDEEATEILAGVIGQMRGAQVPDELPRCPTVNDWAKGFERYLTSGDRQIPKLLVEQAQQVFADLCSSTGPTRLLHGDLQHYNVLFDSDRGWLAIDPKGLWGELEYEVGAAMRNPVEFPEVFLSPATVQRRLDQFVARLDLNYERALRWTFAQAVLSAIWDVEDRGKIDAANSALRLARRLPSMFHPR